MQKLKIFLVTFLLFLTNSVALANVPSTDVSLGWITLGMDRETILSIYGEPNEINRSETPEGGEKWLYGDSFGISLLNDKVCYITTNANNGIATPSGLTVGCDEKRIIELYGDPDFSYTDIGLDFLAYTSDKLPKNEQVDFGLKDKKVCAIRIYASL